MKPEANPNASALGKLSHQSKLKKWGKDGLRKEMKRISKKGVEARKKKSKPSSQLSSQ